jgi:hypothetical protein
VDKKGIPRREGQTGRGQRKTPATGANSDNLFDQWLETKLRSAYSSVLDEPLPEDLIKLVNDKLKD